MASITVRNLDEWVKQRLRVRAAANGRSMEQEVRDILRAAVDEAPPSSRDLAIPSVPVSLLSEASSSTFHHAMP